MEKKKLILILAAAAVCAGGIWTYVDQRNKRIAYEADMAHLEERNAAGEEILRSVQEAYTEEQEAYLAMLADPQYREDTVGTTGLPLSAIGDSVMLGAADVMRETFVNGDVDAAVNRSYYPLYNITAQRTADGTLGNPVIIGIGTNGPLKMSICESVIEMCGEREIFWLTTTNNWQFDNRDTISTLGEEHDNVTVIDWDTYSQGHSDWFYRDGIHLTPEGRKAYTQLIRDTITETLWNKLPEPEDHRVLIAGTEDLLGALQYLKADSGTDILAEADPQALKEEISVLAEKNILPENILLVLREGEAEVIADLGIPAECGLKVIVCGSGETEHILFDLNEEESPFLLDGVHLNDETEEKLASLIQNEAGKIRK